MRLRGLLIVAIAGLLGATCPYTTEARQSRQPRAFVLNVTVTDHANRYVLDLDLPDFAVFEDGVKQDVTFFAQQRQSVALSLLLDSSASMAGECTRRARSSSSERSRNLPK